jgi:tetratricopeptide (TPR) repeat protein
LIATAGVKPAPPYVPIFAVVQCLLGALCACSLTFGAPPAPDSTKWLAVHTPHFTVLTAANAKTAERWAADLERFRVGLAEVMPVDPKRLTPVMVVIFPDEKAFRPYKLLQNGKPAEIGGYFARTDYVNAIGLAQDLSGAETRRTIFHEATHWFSSARQERLPVWLEEGLAELFSTFLADDKQFMIGDSLLAHVRYLREVRLPSLARVMNTARDRLNYDDRERTGQFYATAWLFTHWAMFGDPSPGPASLRRYVEELHRGTDPDAAFKAAFGGDYDAIDRQLATYLKKGKYIRKIYPLPQNAVAMEPPKAASPLEVDYALGALLLVGQGPASALPHFVRAIESAPDDPRGWEALGFVYLQQGRKADAFDAFDHAARAGSKLALVWNNRAALRQEMEHSEEFVVTTDGSSFAPAAEDFRQALELDPLCQSAYQGLAGVTYGVEPFDPKDLARMERGLREFPEDRWIAVGRAAARLRSGKVSEGEAELKQILQEAERLPVRVRRLAENVLENEKLKTLSARAERYYREQKYTELVAEFDEALMDPAISPQNRAGLRSMRKQADQSRRISEAVTACNAGRLEDALVLLHGVLDEQPATGLIRVEAENLLKQITAIGVRPR